MIGAGHGSGAYAAKYYKISSSIGVLGVVGFWVLRLGDKRTKTVAVVLFLVSAMNVRYLHSRMTQSRQVLIGLADRSRSRKNQWHRNKLSRKGITVSHAKI